MQTVVRNAPNLDLHHIILLDGHIDGGEGVVDLLDLGGVVGHRHVLLSDIAQLLLSCTFLAIVLAAKTLFRFVQASLSVLASRMYLSSSISNTKREAVHYSACCMLLGLKVHVCHILCYIIHFFDIAEVRVSMQVLVHLVGPRRIVVRIELFYRT